jgi:hypothetical protein
MKDVTIVSIILTSLERSLRLQSGELLVRVRFLGANGFHFSNFANAATGFMRCSKEH